MASKAPERKGARTVASVDSKVLKQLETGTLESANLTEGLAINMGKLMRQLRLRLRKMRLI